MNMCVFLSGFRGKKNEFGDEFCKSL